jgi:hypothetical protein
MTDKQIIIDGKQTTKEDFTDNFSIELTNCNINERKQIGSRYFDIILRKEQECEELKAKCRKYCEINEQETKDFAELKAENEKLKQTLAEIKEIAGQIENKIYM